MRIFPDSYPLLDNDRYWSEIERAARRPAFQDRASAQDIWRRYGPLQAIRYTQGWADVPNFPAPLPARWEYPDHLLIEIAERTVEADIRSVRDIGRRPTQYVGPGAPVSCDQYWDAVEDLARYAQRRSDPQAQARILAEAHPYTGAVWWSADVLACSENLFHRITDPAQYARWKEGWHDELDTADRYNEAGRLLRVMVQELAEHAMQADAERIIFAQGHYIPNMRPAVYFDEVRKLTLRTPANNFGVGIAEASKFVADLHDALDVLRLSWAPNSALGGAPTMRNLGYDGPAVTLIYNPPSNHPGEPTMPQTTPVELVIRAGRVAAYNDTATWNTVRKPWPSKAPTPLTLDEYLDGVQNLTNAAFARYRHGYAYGWDAFVEALKSELTSRAHPWVAVLSSGFNFRILDVLAQTGRPNALTEERDRRKGLMQKGATDPFLDEVLMETSTQRVLRSIASAAMIGDCLDEMGSRGIIQAELEQKEFG